MLPININRDVEQYQESVAFGLNGQQTIAALVTLAVGMGVTCLLYFKTGLPLEVSIYAAVPCCIMVMVPALKTKDGLSMLEQIKRNSKKGRVLFYHSEEPGECPGAKTQGNGKSTKTRGSGRKRKGRLVWKKE